MFSIRSHSSQEPKAWKKPDFRGGMPHILQESDLIFLGEDRRGWRVFRHSSDAKLGELAERPRAYTEEEQWPELPVVERGEDKRRWWFFDVFEPGSFERGQIPAMPERRRLAKPASRTLPMPVDSLTYSMLGAAIPPKTRVRPWQQTEVPSIEFDRGLDSANMAEVAATLERPGTQRIEWIDAQPPARGVEATYARLRRAKASVVLAADCEHVVVLTEGGRHHAGVLELVELMKPLILADLRGDPAPSCVVTEHDEPAVTVAAGGAPWCGQCRPETSAEAAA
jgi:hypothetical protein